MSQCPPACRFLRHVACTDSHLTVGQLQQLKQVFRIARNFLKHLFRSVQAGFADDDLLNLGKLVHTIQSVHIPSGRANLIAEAYGHGCQPNRVRNIHDLTAVIRDQRHFRSAYKPLILTCNAVRLIQSEREKPVLRMASARTISGTSSNWNPRSVSRSTASCCTARCNATPAPVK